MQLHKLQPLGCEGSRLQARLLQMASEETCHSWPEDMLCPLGWEHPLSCCLLGSC